MKKIGVFIVGALSAMYLLNPTAGVFELLPDNIPLIGNLDEAGAVALLLSSLRYFGLDFANIFKKDEETQTKTEDTTYSEVA